MWMAGSLTNDYLFMENPVSQYHPAVHSTAPLPWGEARVRESRRLPKVSLPNEKVHHLPNLLRRYPNGPIQWNACTGEQVRQQVALIALGLVG